jgi:RNA polymerase sigma-70 factor, ECF subfamily
MMAAMSELAPSNADETTELIRRAVAGDRGAWSAIVGEHGPRLRRIVRLRLDPRLTGVVDPSDVLQDAYKLVHSRLPQYLDQSRISFFLWLRYMVGDALSRVHRQQLRVKKRRPANGVQPFPEASSVNLAGLLVGREKSPVSEAIREERRRRVIEALDALSTDDREVLVLRHFEQLTALETATVLGITEAAARKRYLRALERITGLLKGIEDDREVIS